jgi:hypothetical protein
MQHNAVDALDAVVLSTAPNRACYACLLTVRRLPLRPASALSPCMQHSAAAPQDGEGPALWCLPLGSCSLCWCLTRPSEIETSGLQPIALLSATPSPLCVAQVCCCWGQRPQPHPHGLASAHQEMSAPHARVDRTDGVTDGVTESKESDPPVPRIRRARQQQAAGDSETVLPEHSAAEG